MLEDLIDKLTKDLSLTPEQQFRVTADIKRFVHQEKADLFSRYISYAQGIPIFDRTDPMSPMIIGYESPRDPWLHRLLLDSYDNHQHWASKTDEEIVTWDVGTHKFKQGENK